MTIKGANFETGLPVDSVTFSGNAINHSSFTSVAITTDMTTADAPDPRQIIARTGPISVTNSVGTVTSSTFALIAPPPTITSFSPSSGPAGTSVDINGTNLWVSGLSVEFNGFPADSVIIHSDTQLTVTAPAAGSGSGPGPIRIVTDGGVASISTFTET